MTDLLLQRAALADRPGSPRPGRPASELFDVAVADGKISSVRPTASPDGPPVGPDGLSARAARVIDLDGRLLLGAPAEPHAHLDKALTVDRVPNPSGDLAGAIAGWRAHRGSITSEDFVERATRAAEMLVANGCTAIRSHVDLGVDIGTVGLEALLEVKAGLAGRAELQLVGLLNGLTGPDGAAQVGVMRRALDLGLDVVGGVPHLEAEPARAIDIILDLAGSAGCPVDLHADENLDPSSSDLAVLAERILATGFEPGATASHCCALGMADEGRQLAVAARVAEAGIAVITLPVTNLYLQARGRGEAPPRGLTPVGVLAEAGVAVAAGADNLRDPFNPMGRADPMETAMLAVTAAHVSPEQAWAMVSTGARRAMGLGPVTIEPGSPADLVALPASSITDAVAAAPTDRLVLHRGRIVAPSSASIDVPGLAR